MKNYFRKINEKTIEEEKSNVLTVKSQNFPEEVKPNSGKNNRQKKSRKKNSSRNLKKNKSLHFSSKLEKRFY